MEASNNYVSLSQTQLGIYLDCMKRGEGTYNGHFLLTLDNNIDMKKLASAIDKAVAAHPSFLKPRAVHNRAGWRATAVYS